MQYEIEIDGRIRRIVVSRHGEGFVATVDGHASEVQAARVDPHTLSLLVNGATVASTPGTSALTVSVDGTPVHVTVNARRRSRSGGTEVTHTGGAQRLVAPMPGKVVRVLVKLGDRVGARQPIVVIEAMKMESELRVVADGIVSELRAEEGMLG